VEIAEHIRVLEREAKLFAEAADAGGLDVPIDTCPGWTMRELVRHLSEIHLWAAGHVARTAVTLAVDDVSSLMAAWPDLAVFWPADDDLIGYYLETNANLVHQLDSAPADLDTWTFLPAPSPLAMWARRQAHETAVHRFDAEHAARISSHFDPAFASDGVDELLMAFAPRADSFPIEAAKTMAVHAVDTGDRWHVTMAPDGITAARRNDAADVSLAGTAADLYLALWNRGDDPAIEVTGDHSALEAWHTNHRVRWPRA
jgi:uncharacterized protein (TIGR03083 family)